jgi:hypothetical protein
MPRSTVLVPYNTKKYKNYQGVPNHSKNKTMPRSTQLNQGVPSPPPTHTNGVPNQIKEYQTKPSSTRPTVTIPMSTPYNEYQTKPRIQTVSVDRKPPKKSNCKYYNT